MKNLKYKMALLLLVIVQFASAQETKMKKSFFTVQLGFVTGTTTHYENQNFGAGGSGDTFRLGAYYSYHLSDKLDLFAGLQFHPIRDVRPNSGDVTLIPITFDAHYKFKAQPKTTYLYVNYGIAPKLGGNFYGGTTLGIGLGWQYQPKLLKNKPLNFAAGYNLNRIKDVYTPVTFSSPGGDITNYYYYNYKLTSLALTVGISF